MKQRLADYVADFLVNHGIKDCFMVVGGGAMHLNDALGHKEGLHCTYNHHEQACAIAAEAYARVDNKIAALCDHRTRWNECDYGCFRWLAGFYTDVGDFWSGAL